MNKLEQKILALIEKARLEPTDYNQVLSEGDLEFKYKGCEYLLDIEFDYDLQNLEIHIFEDEVEIEVSNSFVDMLFNYMDFLCESHIEFERRSQISAQEDLDHQFYHFGYGRQ